MNYQKAEEIFDQGLLFLFQEASDFRYSPDGKGTTYNSWKEYKEESIKKLVDDLNKESYWKSYLEYIQLKQRENDLTDEESDVFYDLENNLLQPINEALSLLGTVHLDEQEQFHSIYFDWLARETFQHKLILFDGH